jgi:hypothetical protein
MITVARRTTSMSGSHRYRRCLKLPLLLASGTFIHHLAYYDFKFVTAKALLLHFAGGSHCNLEKNDCMPGNPQLPRLKAASQAETMQHAFQVSCKQRESDGGALRRCMSTT